jgi:DNA-binding GntR family transcriptional regulator
VRRLTVAQYLEIRDIRLLLEPLAAERALDTLDAGGDR